MNSKKHIQQRLNELEEQYDLQSKKIKRLRKALAIETNAGSKFKLEIQIEDAEKEREETQRQIGEVVAELEESSDLDDNFLKVPYKLWDFYEQLEELGKGGIAEVYKVQNVRTQNISALKVLQFKHHTNSQIISRFWAEGRILGVLGETDQHHIVKVHNMGETADNEYFIEMEFIDGKTLDQLLEGKQKYCEKEALDILYQLATALKHVHSFNIIHRDLKPQNIMVTQKNRLTLMDFGIAKRIDSCSIVTTIGKFLGSFAYCAPEQLDPNEFGDVSFRTDIYSLGILAYQLLMGKLPYKIDSHTQAIIAHTTKEMPELKGKFSPEMNYLIQKCTQKYQNDRYQTIQELQADIEKLQLDGDENLLGLEAEEPATRELAPLPAETTEHGIDLILVQGGTFTMGDNSSKYDEEKPEHKVTLNSFYMGKYPVTNEQYAKFLNEYGSDTVKEGEHKGKLMIEEYKWGVKKENGIWKPQKGYENHPIVRVTWYGANEFCKFYGYRLPTEAEWEYAARGGNKTKGYKYSGSSNLDEVAWYGSNSDGKTHPVNDNKKKPNELGIYHMSGNVYEWCEDWYDKNYYQYCKENNIKNNPVNTDNNSGRRVLRGGSWNVNSNGVRAASRSYYSPKLRSYNRGFRVVLVSPVRAR